MICNRTFSYILCVSLCSYLHSQTHFTEITDEVGILPFSSGENYGSGCALIDVDQNGFLDILVLSNESSPNRLYLNQGEYWENPIEIGGANLRSRTPLWFDFDGDGDLDVFIQSDCYDTSTCFDHSVFQLLRNDGNNEFTDVTISSNIANGSVINSRLKDGIYYSGGTSSGDLNLDGHLDLLVTRWNGDLFLFINNGDGTFVKSSLLESSGTKPYYQPIIFDFTSDGWPEIFITVDGGEPNLFFRNDSSTFLTDIAEELGMNHAQNDMGVTIGDYDEDGDYDFYITNIARFTANSQNTFF